MVPSAVAPQAAPPSAFAVAASFTADAAVAAAERWLASLDVPGGIDAAPAGRFLIDLHDPGAPVWSAAARVVLVRLSDVAGPGAPRALGARRLASALHGYAGPTLVMLAPDRDADPAADRAALTQAFAAEAGGAVPEIAPEIVLASDLFASFGVDDPFDPQAEAAVGAPYGEAAMAAIGAGLARWRARLARPPLKLVCVDGDGVLWDGVLGEDGLDGVTLSPPRARLQAALAAAARAGVLVAVVSKNEPADLTALFARRADFPLRADDLVAVDGGWQPKPARVARLAAGLGVAPSSALFLDDTPMEVAAMRASGAARAVRVPAESADFAERLWLLDRGPATEAGRGRLASLRAEAERRERRAAAPSLAEFFAGLELRIETAPATPADIPRIAELGRRTNQFNASLERPDEAALAAELGALWVVRARDRFGDYGTVGAMRARAVGGRFVCDLFLLSCRALGRGVEHRMLAVLGEAAEAAGCADIEIALRVGPRNAPARTFFGARAAVEAETARIAADAAAATRFDPEADAPAPADPAAQPAQAPMEASAGSDEAYERLAVELTTADGLLAALRGPAAPRPDAAGPFIAPAPGLEAELARLWAEALNVERVGAQDRLADLGARSLDIVRLHSRLAARPDRAVELADLFRFDTVAALAAHLAAPPGAGRSAGDPAARGRAMRAARAAFAGRREGRAS